MNRRFASPFSKAKWTRVKWQSLGLVVVVYLGALGLARAQESAPSGGVVATPSQKQTPSPFCSTLKQTHIAVGQLQVPVYELSSYRFLKCVPELPTTEWVVRKSRWGKDDQEEWKHFLKVLGESQCNTLEKCLKNPSSNTLWTEWDAQMAFYTDCADFPYFLRAYFSFKRHLPFSFVTAYGARPLTPEMQNQQERDRQGIVAGFRDDPVRLEKKLANFEQILRDHRSTWNGNYPQERYFIPEVVPRSRTFSNVTWLIHQMIATGTYRMFETPGDVLADFYSPALRPGSIGPGTALYKTAGHAAIVYSVTSDGVAHFIDANPDNSIARGEFNREYVRSNPNLGGGFKNWRPFVLMQHEGERWFEARPDSSGQIREAIFRFLSDEEITYQASRSGCLHRDRRFPCDYSDEQYRGNSSSAAGDYRKAKFLVGGREVDYFDYIRFKLSGGKKANPVEAFRAEMKALCDDLKGREATVRVAIHAGLSRRSHPESYPDNIYAASGEWESYSSPGRDTRIRGRVGQLVNLAKHLIRAVRTGDPTYSYRAASAITELDSRASQIGSLKSEFVDVYQQIANECDIHYVNSAGREIDLSFEEALSRVSLMSFDPYLCVERRWGATEEDELKTCRDDEVKSEWYRLTQFLRNRTERDTAEVMGYNLEELRHLEQQRKVDNRAEFAPFDLLVRLKAL